MGETQTGKAVQYGDLLAWIESAELRAKRNKAMSEQQRNYDLCRLEDGRTICLWELRQWLEWNHGIEAINRVSGPKTAAG